MKHIVFEYKDEYTHGEWREQDCVMASIRDCIEWYGLNYCEYRIIKAEDINED